MTERELRKGKSKGKQFHCIDPVNTIIITIIIIIVIFIIIIIIIIIVLMLSALEA